MHTDLHTTECHGPTCCTSITVDLPCNFFALRTAGRHLDEVSDVARTLHFVPAMIALADRVVAGMTAAVAEGAGERAGQKRRMLHVPPSTNTTAPPLHTLPSFFNGVHLQVETDARDWSSILGEDNVVREGFMTSMKAAGLDANTPLYAASGLLTYCATGQMEVVIAKLVGAGLASSVHYTELHLSPADKAGLKSEQSALVDFLVLAKAARFVGFGPSTFSFYVREHRALVGGMPRSTSLLVNASTIGTDALFEAAGHAV